LCSHMAIRCYGCSGNSAARRRESRMQHAVSYGRNLLTRETRGGVLRTWLLTVAEILKRAATFLDWLGLLVAWYQLPAAKPTKKAPSHRSLPPWAACGVQTCLGEGGTFCRLPYHFSAPVFIPHLPTIRICASVLCVLQAAYHTSIHFGAMGIVHLIPLFV